MVNLEGVLKDIAEGKALLLVKGVHRAANKSLKRFIFFVKSETILWITNNGGNNWNLVSL